MGEHAGGGGGRSNNLRCMLKGHQGLVKCISFSLPMLKFRKVAAISIARMMVYLNYNNWELN